MRRSPLFLVGIVALALASPAEAQEGPITFGVFVTVESSNVSDFEEAAIEHAEWHADQNDTWAWPVYQAMTGGQVEYVVLTPGHEWADFDNPTVDMAEDQAQWAGSGSEFTSSEVAMFWQALPGVSNPPDDATAYPLIQVTEFQVKSGGAAAVQHGMAKFKEAVDMAGGGGPPFGWSTVVSADAPPTVFVAVSMPNFAALGAGGPTPEQVLISAFGEVEGRQIGEDFAAATIATSSQIWILRPDLSYFPG